MLLLVKKEKKKNQAFLSFEKSLKKLELQAEKDLQSPGLTQNLEKFKP